MSGGLVTFVVPDGVDDRHRVSGGNVYDRRLRDALRRRGWTVAMAEVADGGETAAALGKADRRGALLIDGLVAGWAPDAVARIADRARTVVLAHMVSAAFPGADPARVDAERRALSAADRIVATSRWIAGELIRLGIAPADRLVVAVPGAEADPVAGPAGYRDLLCVGVVAPHKGQDVLLDALGRIHETGWSCALVGSRSVDADYATRIAVGAERFAGRVRMTGVLDGADLLRAYRRSGLLVAPSRVEGYGMAIADARGRGLPVIASAVGGIPEAIAGGGAVLVPPDDPAALAAALHRWMTDPALRARLRLEALHARPAMPRWEDAAARVEEALA